MTLSFDDFLQHVLVEQLHPELQSVVSSKSYHPKQSVIAKKIKDLTARGEKTGIEGNTPKGSSRAYLKHEKQHEITLDGYKRSIPVGTKVAIKHPGLDPHHDKHEHDGMNLGELQNHAEGGDHWVNREYRILTPKSSHEPHVEGKPPEYESNKEGGIFPPLIDHDHEHHQWTQVGHARDIKAGEFNKLTKTQSHPKGISHKDFHQALDRFHNSNNGRYHKSSDAHEAHLDHVDEHPLIQKFQDYHGNTGHPTGDYRQRKNLGVFEHPDGSQHIVARDHGFNTNVANAYSNAHKRKSEAHRAKHDRY